MHSKTMQVFQINYQKKQSMMNYTTLLDLIITISENLKPILDHIVEKFPTILECGTNYVSTES